MQKLKLRFFPSRLGVSKIVILILIIIVVLATAGISYYAATQTGSPSASPTPTPSSEPAVAPTPTSTFPSTPPQASTPTSPTTTPTASVNPTLTSIPTPIPTSYPTSTPTPIATLTPTSSANPTTPSPSELSTQEKIREAVMSFIRLSHPETAQFMNDLVWTGGRATPQGLVGAETYIYYSQGWNVTIKYPVVLHPIYTITADYSAVSTAIPYRIVWKGTWQNEVINETSYTFAQ